MSTEKIIDVPAVVMISGEIVVVASGVHIVIDPPTSIVGAGLFIVGNQSGGAMLTSGVTTCVALKAEIGNSGAIHVAGGFLQSGEGFVLRVGDGVSIEVDNFGDVFLFAEASGDTVSYLGV